MGVVDALGRLSGNHIVVVRPAEGELDEKKAGSAEEESMTISLPGAADGTNTRKVICAARKSNLLCTAFIPC
jgi:hypothetical protein